jgi:8-oxo-dGTP pyrophosphatase MutT (NUDIX family)
MGGDQDRLIGEELAEAGFATARRWEDEDGDLRGLEALYRGRRSARVVMMDEHERVLLLSGRDPGDPTAPRFWFVPGGGADRGETLEQAAVREVYEETGARLGALGTVVWERDVSFVFDGVPFAQHEWYFFVRVAHFEARATGLTDLEQRSGIGARWWALGEVAQAEAPVHPPGLAELVAGWLRGGPA